MKKRVGGFTLAELLAVSAVLIVFTAILSPVGWAVYRKSSLAISANNLRQLGAGMQSYLADHRYHFWPYVSFPQDGSQWWFGWESMESVRGMEGKRSFDPGRGPLAGYIPAGLQPDPTFRFTGKAFKPKYASGYLGVGYNVSLGGGWIGQQPTLTLWDLSKPSEVVVFSTSAQVNTFQAPATRRNPMIEEFYGIDPWEYTVHFRHDDHAMVIFANGSAGFLPMDRSTLDPRAPAAKVGRFAPRGSTRYLLSPK